MINEFKKYLEIDRNALDEELAHQPQLFFTVSEAYVEAAAMRDELKEKLATTDAELDNLVRIDLEQSQSKVTEAIVKNAIQSHPAHKAASDAYLAAKKEADVLLAMKDSFYQRASMIRDLSSLYIANYYDSSSTKGTSATDSATYKRQRERLAEARQTR